MSVFTQGDKWLTQARTGASAVSSADHFRAGGEGCIFGKFRFLNLYFLYLYYMSYFIKKLFGLTVIYITNCWNTGEADRSIHDFIGRKTALIVKCR